MTSSEPQIRVLRVATGAHFLSFSSERPLSRRSLEEVLDRLPHGGDLVVNVGGLDAAGALSVAACLRASGRLDEPDERIIVVCEEPAVRGALRRSEAEGGILLELSLEKALRDVLGRTWLGAA
jgi:hypothetical protein